MSEAVTLRPAVPMDASAIRELPGMPMPNGFR
jgi:hypothetical protein